MPAEKAPTPHPRNIYPNCETVEYANTFLISFCAKPIVAARTAVANPMTATHSIAIGAFMKIADARAVMYTPAVTIRTATPGGGPTDRPSRRAGGAPYIRL